MANYNEYILQDRSTADKWALIVSDGELSISTSSQPVQPEIIVEDDGYPGHYWRIFVDGGELAIEDVLTVQDDEVYLWDAVNSEYYKLIVEDGELIWSSGGSTYSAKTLICRVSVYYIPNYKNLSCRLITRKKTNRILTCQTAVTQPLPPETPGSHCRVLVRQSSSKNLTCRVSSAGNVFILNCRVTVTAASGANSLQASVEVLRYSSAQIQNKITVFRLLSKTLRARLHVLKPNTKSLLTRLIVLKRTVSAIVSRIEVLKEIGNILYLSLEVGLTYKNLKSRVMVLKESPLTRFRCRVTVCYAAASSNLACRVFVGTAGHTNLICRVNPRYNTANRSLICQVNVQVHIWKASKLYGSVTVYYPTGALNLLSRVEVRPVTTKQLKARLTVYQIYGVKNLKERVVVRRVNTKALRARLTVGGKEGYMVHSLVWPSFSLRSLCQRNGM